MWVGRPGYVDVGFVDTDALNFNPIEAPMLPPQSVQDQRLKDRRLRAEPGILGLHRSRRPPGLALAS